MKETSRMAIANIVAYKSKGNMKSQSYSNDSDPSENDSYLPTLLDENIWATVITSIVTYDGLPMNKSETRETSPGFGTDPVATCFGL